MVGTDQSHVPVLLEQVVTIADPGPGQVIVDGTFGDGGYSRALLAAGASVVAIDRDPDAVTEGQPLSKAAGGRLTLVRGRFGALDWVARGAGYDSVDGVVLDIGVSSMQLDRAERGFSFLRDGPLDMRMSKDGPTAADLVNSLDAKALARLLATFGEEKRAGAIARAIVEARRDQPFKRTRALAELVEKTLGRNPRDPIHPATRTFQALRIVVNQELDELADALGAAETILAEGGRIVVVTFHSLEDRIVKRFLAERGRISSGRSRHLPDAPMLEPTFKLVGKGIVTPDETEQSANPRARSAKLRAAVRTAAPARPVDASTIGVPSLRAIGGGA